jgi:transcriptional regulator of acetoin/glycerol metabolism
MLVTVLRQAQRNRAPVVFTVASNEASDEASSMLAGGTYHRVALEPLRRRRHEIPEIAARMLATAPGGASRSLAPDAIRVLSSQWWPGNLTELRRVVELMATIPGSGSLRADEIPASHRKPASLPTPRAEAERDIIVGALQTAGGNKRRAAELLAVSRSTLYNRLRALQIEA